MCRVYLKKQQEGVAEPMKIELTARDKKLLTFMGVFVLVALIGYYGVLPQLKKAREYSEQIEEQELIQNVYQTKVGQLIVVETNNDQLEKLIDGAKENYYPMMDSDAVDHLVTNTVIDKYGLKAYDLTIGERQLAGLGPYMYSNKAITGASEAREKALQAAAPEINEEGMILFSDAVAADPGTTGIYVVSVQMRLGGDIIDIQRFLDDMAYTDKKLRLVDYSVQHEEIRIPHDDGTMEIVSDESLNVSMELYMCEE